VVPVKRITCMIRPHRLEQVKSAIAALGVSGLNVSDVRGTGNSPETAAWFAGEEHLISLPIKAKIEVIVPDELEEPVLAEILANARTGEPGDGKIFIERVVDALRVRTGERGEAAL
jgi:nitrogen regulatory protein P-II 1